MKIKKHLSVYLESGYLFDDMSGRLKWFEIDKILISFTYGVVRYVGTWGGCRAEKTLDGKLFYSSEECFKKGKSIPKTKLSIYDVFKSFYVRYNAYDSPTEVYSGFGETEAESRAMLLFDLLEKKILTPDGLNLKEVDRRKEYENEFE